jgi:hypothetical protein
MITAAEAIVYPIENERILFFGTKYVFSYVQGVE